MTTGIIIVQAKMGNCFGQQQQSEQTIVYIYVKLQSKEQGNWDWNQMLQEISDVKYNITDIIFIYCI